MLSTYRLIGKTYVIPDTTKAAVELLWEDFQKSPLDEILNCRRVVGDTYLEFEIPRAGNPTFNSEWTWVATVYFHPGSAIMDTGDGKSSRQYFFPYEDPGFPGSVLSTLYRLLDGYPRVPGLKALEQAEHSPL